MQRRFPALLRANFRNGRMCPAESKHAVRMEIEINKFRIL